MEKVSEMVDGFNESFNSYKKNTTDQIKTLQKISGESIDLKDRIQILYSIVMKKPDSTDLVAIYDRLKFMVTADKIEELEQKLEALQTAMADPSFYDKPFSETEPLLSEVAQVQADLEAATERWIELEEMTG